MTWTSGGDGKHWRSPLEVGAVAVGEVFLWASVPLPRSWAFKLLYSGVEVYAWHISATPGHHSNPAGCPPDRGFPAKVRSAEHEHFWIEGIRARKCAKPLKGLGGLSHRETFAKFCERVRLAFDGRYEDPSADEQLAAF